MILSLHNKIIKTALKMPRILFNKKSTNVIAYKSDIRLLKSSGFPVLPVIFSYKRFRAMEIAAGVETRSFAILSLVNFNLAK